MKHSQQDEIDFALWLSCTCDTLGKVNFSISDWRSVSQLCGATVSHRGEDAAALTLIGTDWARCFSSVACDPQTSGSA